MKAVLTVAKVSGLIALIGLIDMFELIKRSKAIPILLLLALIIACNQLGVEIAPGYILPIHFDSTFDTLSAAALILVALPLLVMADFSFGWLVGLYAYLAVAGYVIYSYASTLPYDHAVARLAIVASLIAFLVPALFVRREKTFAISDRTMQWLLIGLMAFAVVIIGLDASYGYRFAGFSQSMALRGEITRPTVLNYVSDMLTCSVLPFALAWFVSRRRWLHAGMAAIIMMAFFPMLLSKVVLFSPIWTIVLFVLFSRLEAKLAVVISLAVPLIVTALIYRLSPSTWMPFFVVDIRMIATPSIAIDRYLAFFADHPLTHFCQINMVGHLTGCPYTEQLGVIMHGVYNEGNFNASLFATEGIASVGPLLAPLVTFLCGLVIAAGNVASSRLSPAFVAASSGVFLNVLMNVPLSTSMLSNGGILLFALWSLTKRQDREVRSDARRDARYDAPVAISAFNVSG
jgi:hypothetical protein